MVHPLAKGAEDYLCRRPHYLDGWCKQHHPSTEQERLAKLADYNQKKETEEVMTIDKAIVFLVKNGYRVEMVKN